MDAPAPFGTEEGAEAKLASDVDLLVDFAGTPTCRGYALAATLP